MSFIEIMLVYRTTQKYHTVTTAGGTVPVQHKTAKPALHLLTAITVGAGAIVNSNDQVLIRLYL